MKIRLKCIITIFLLVTSAYSIGDSNHSFNITNQDNSENHQKNKSEGDKHIKDIMISDSINAYKGLCPCPYSRKRSGKRCGNSSAYIRPGGSEPLCYDSDVTVEMIEDFKRRNGFE